MNYKNARVWKCEYCKADFIGRKAYYTHLKECDEKKKLPHDSMGRIISVEGHRKSTETLKRKIASGEFKPKEFSPETRKKLSESASRARKKSLAEGRGNHWICPAIKMSYAEQYFNDCFKNLKLEFKNNVWINKRYCVDFLFGKYYFEVDGEQHFTPEGLLHDKERDEYLTENGYVCVGRCRWKDFKLLSLDEKTKYIEGIVKQINT